MENKVDNARKLIEDAVKMYPRLKVACSFGKDSMVVVHLAKEVNKDIEIFSVMTRFKPADTLEYLEKMNRLMNLNVTVYCVGNILLSDNIKKVILDEREFDVASIQSWENIGRPLYLTDPDKCCQLLKVDPTREALKDANAWITGLRCTEGRTRTDYKEIEEKGGLVKINPILTFTETDVWKYLATRGIKPHPWYRANYRSIGCAPCSNPGGELERSGRWMNTSKCGGECGIHTQRLK